MFKTKITEMLGIEYPIIAGPLAYLSHAELVSAVSNAGGLGVMVSTTLTTKELREEIRKTKDMTDKPFGVNVTFQFRAESTINYEEYFDVIIGEGVRIVETSGKSPEQYMKQLKDANVTVMHRATRTRDIKKAERVGADAVVIMGFEATGHPGVEDVTSLVRIPVAADAVKIPVIAAGGIADARGVVAALALGAEGVMMGTRFFACKEAPMHPNIGEWLMGLGEADTMMIMHSFKATERVVRTEYNLKIKEMEDSGATIEELVPFLSGIKDRDAYISGDPSQAPIPVGQVVGLIHDMPTVKEIMDGMINDAKVIAKRLNDIGIKP